MRIRCRPWGDARLQDDLQVAREATDRTVAIVRQLLAFTGRQVVQRSVLDLNAVVVDAAQLLVPALGRDVTWQTHCADGLWSVFAASDQLHHVLANPVLNARDAGRASASPGVVRISTENIAATDDRPDQVRRIGEDSGIGMNAETQAHAIDPFFTTKPVGQGTGLGLSMVYGIINALGGRTDITSAPGAGTRVTLTIPRTAPVGRASPSR
jgi:signal transduction histidine kinase